MRIDRLFLVGVVSVGVGASGCSIPAERSAPGQSEAGPDGGASEQPPWLLEGEDAPPDAAAPPAAEEEAMGEDEPMVAECDVNEEEKDEGVQTPVDEPMNEPTDEPGESEPSPKQPDAGVPVDAGGEGKDTPTDAAVKTATPTRHGEIVISEIMANPDTLSDSEGEWIELYNASDRALSLEGCTLADHGSDAHVIAEVDPALELQPGAYAALARSEAPGFGPDYVYGAFGLTNSADEVVLRCGDTLIDEVVIGGEGPSPKAGVSLSLAPGLLDATANDDATAWCEASLSYNGDLGTPGEVNSGCEE